MVRGEVGRVAVVENGEGVGGAVDGIARLGELSLDLIRAALALESPPAVVVATPNESENEVAAGGQGRRAKLKSPKSSLFLQSFDVYYMSFTSLDIVTASKICIRTWPVSSYSGHTNIKEATWKRRCRRENHEERRITVTPGLLERATQCGSNASLRFPG